jgi:flavin reductase ActVB
MYPMAAPALDLMEFRNAMARFPSGVTVAITTDPDGKQYGFTASAFSSLSLDPPLLLVCLDKKAESHPAFHGSGHFTVSILAADQLATAMRFASKGVDKFEGIPVKPGPVSGVPLIDGAAVQLDCRTHQHLEGGDHTIIVGEVLWAASTENDPLVHFNRRFGRFTDE